MRILLDGIQRQVDAWRHNDKALGTILWRHRQRRYNPQSSRRPGSGFDNHLKFCDASSTLGHQFDDLVLRSCVFKFHCPGKFIDFIQGLGSEQQGRFRHIEFNLFDSNHRSRGCVHCGDSRITWDNLTKEMTSAIAQSITIDLGLDESTHLAGFFGPRWCATIVSRKHPSRKRRYFEDCEVKSHYTRTKDFIEVLSKQLKRIAPKAQIRIPAISRCVIKDRQIFQSILNELE